MLLVFFYVIGIIILLYITYNMCIKKLNIFLNYVFS